MSDYTWAATVRYPLKHKPMIAAAIPFMLENVFECWKFKPVITLHDVDDGEGEFDLRLEYDNTLTPEANTQGGHDALDSVQAFIEGMVYYRDKVVIEVSSSYLSVYVHSDTPNEVLVAAANIVRTMKFRLPGEPDADGNPEKWCAVLQLLKPYIVTVGKLNIDGSVRT